MYVHNYLEKASELFDKPDAFIDGSAKYTFQEIFDKSEVVASYLHEQGIRKGERIGIFSNKCIEEIIIIFAALQLGVVFVHINPFFKEEHLKHVVDDCNIKLLFLQKSKIKIVEKAFIKGKPIEKIVCFTHSDDSPLCIQAVLSEILKNDKNQGYKYEEVNGDDIASIIYTSGSTGMPKGITITHQIFKDATEISSQILRNTPDDQIISATPFSFDGALSQLFTAVYSGATLVLLHSNLPKDIVNALIENRISGFHAMPSFWRMLLHKHSVFTINEYPHLRYVSIIGEAFPKSELMKLRQILKHTQFYMMYGTTEAFRSAYLPPEHFDEKYPSVGIPLPGVTIKIIDDDGNECKVGEIGQIVHSGKFVSPGYWNNQKKTKEVFKSGHLYTNDLGKLDEDGYLYFVGRKDNMIKANGFRISPSEVESSIFKLSGVKDVVVFGQDNKINACISMESGYTISEQQIIVHCRKELPHYMAINNIIFVDEIEKTGNYKNKRF